MLDQVPWRILQYKSVTKNVSDGITNCGPVEMVEATTLRSSRTPFFRAVTSSAPKIGAPFFNRHLATFAGTAVRGSKKRRSPATRVVVLK